MTGRILAIAAVEIRIALRNRWIVTAIALMTGFGLILAFAGSAPAGTLGVDRLTVTVTSLATLSVYLVPLIALLLSYDAFAGEAERGTLPLLLTYPVARREILAGKFGAQLFVLAAAIIIGFGLTALAVWASGGASADSLRHLFRLQWSAIVLGAVFLALGNCLSASVRQAGTAASLAIAVWLIAVVMFDVALLGAVVADNGGMFTKAVFPWLLVISPTDAFRLFNLLAVEAGALNGAGSGLAGATQGLALPDLAPLISLLAWPLALLAVAAAVLRRFEP
jgi:Cu-processing system permease protein